VSVSLSITRHGCGAISRSKVRVKVFRHRCVRGLSVVFEYEIVAQSKHPKTEQDIACGVVGREPT
jgi:hypothetical protein